MREELYAQCFDELIRQVTINCAERGLLLLRVRDELRMTIAAYQTLYESSVAFGMRKALQTEQGKVRDLDEELQVDVLQGVLPLQAGQQGHGGTLQLLLINNSDDKVVINQTPSWPGALW